MGPALQRPETRPIDPFRLQPARDLGLPPVQRARSLQREPGLFSQLASHAWWAFAKTYLKAYHRLQITGQEHLPAEPPFVLVANHTSHLDAPMLSAALPARHRRVAHPVSAGDVFFTRPTASLFSALCLNALPMKRQQMGRHALDELRTRLTDDPCILILFPEGTRSPDGTLAPFKPGLGMLVAGTPVPVVPCALLGAHAALPKHARLPRPKKLHARLGPPLTFEHTPPTKAGWCEVATRLEQRVRQLASPTDH
ncbi:MAG: lysophospholipid acyltransferase family protein [Planctomycetota bacterium]